MEEVELNSTVRGNGAKPTVEDAVKRDRSTHHSPRFGFGP